MGYGLGPVTRPSPVTAYEKRRSLAGTRRKTWMGVVGRLWTVEGECGDFCTILGRRGCGWDVAL